MLCHFEDFLPSRDYKRLEMISQDCRCDFVVVRDSKSSWVTMCQDHPVDTKSVLRSGK